MKTYNKNSPETIQAMFGSIAQGYDRANAILSWNMHKRWNRELVHQVGVGSKLLDLCAGTGDIAYAYLQENPTAEADLLDFCPEMLACAAAKKKVGQQLKFIQADAMALPFQENSYPCATMAYGIRNIENPLKSLQEIFRVLQPGGRLAILELTQPKNALIRAGHRFYLRTILPPLGRLITSDKEAYRYLCNSIQAFVPPETLARLAEQAGFRNIQLIPLTFGTATILRAQK